MHAAVGTALRADGYSACPDRLPERQPEARGAVRIQVDDVSYAYRDGVSALDAVSLQLRDGEFVAIIGKNGSGKTTLAKHLNGLLTPVRGRVRLGGVDLGELQPHQRACEVGFVFQDPDHQLFAATVADEVAFGPRNLGLPQAEVEERTREALDAVHLADHRDADPFLLDKGDRQRLAVASVLSMMPSVLILDEPTTGLDYREQRRMMDLLGGLHLRGKTVVIITHSPWVVAEYATRAVVMAGGRILRDGALRELFNAPDVLAQAAFRAPDITAVGRQFGVTALTVAELAGCLIRCGEV